MPSTAIDRVEERFVPTFDYIRPRDYLRPLAGACLFGICVAAVVSSFGLIFGPACSGLLFIFCLVVYTIQFPITFLISAFVHHQVFLHRLKRYGPEWFIRERNLDMPPAEAFELCLAACGHIPKAHIVSFDDSAGIINLRVKGNFWVTVDRAVQISISRDLEAPEGNPRSKLCIDAQVRLTKFRTAMIRSVWGEKWFPIVFRTDRNLNNKILDNITEFIQSVPNWDHKHISVSEDEHWRKLIGVNETANSTSELNNAA